MGLEGFLSFVKKKHPTVIINEHITLYSHQRVFMDISSYIYKYICIFGNQNTKWLNCIFQMFLHLRQYKIHVVPIFDGKPPDEKQDEIDERKEKRKQTASKVKNLQTAIEHFRSKELTDEDSVLLQDTLTHLQKKNKTTKLKSLLFNIESSSELTDTDILDIENYMFSIQKTIFYIGSKEIDMVKDLLNILGIPYIQAPEEAEACCSYLCKRGEGSAVISCDTDCFAHGCPNTILTFEPSSGMITAIRLEELLEALEMNHQEFVDYAILIGCDYNRKTKIKNVGPVKALDLIHNYKQIEHIPGYDFSGMDYVGIRQLFNKSYDTLKVKKHRKIDREALEQFIDEHNLQTNMMHIEKIMNDSEKQIQIVFE